MSQRFRQFQNLLAVQAQHHNRQNSKISMYGALVTDEEMQRQTKEKKKQDKKKNVCNTTTIEWKDRIPFPRFNVRCLEKSIP